MCEVCLLHESGEIAETYACEACGAEPNEKCRPGCLGYALENDKLAEFLTENGE